MRNAAVSTFVVSFIFSSCLSRACLGKASFFIVKLTQTLRRVFSLYSRGGYEDALFEQQVMEVVEKHPPSSPLFLFWAPHIVHTPLQVPQHFLDKFAFMEETDKPTHNRQIYHSMVRQHNTQCPPFGPFLASSSDEN